MKKKHLRVSEKIKDATKGFEKSFNSFKKTAFIRTILSLGGMAVSALGSLGTMITSGLGSLGTVITSAITALGTIMLSKLNLSSLKDLATKGGLKKALGSVGTGLRTVGTKATGLLTTLGSSPLAAGAAGLVGVGMGAYDAYGAVQRAGEIHNVKPGEKVSMSQKATAGIGGFLGGNEEAFSASGAAHGAMKGGAIGASIGSIVPGVGTIIGGAFGAIAGGILGFVGGKNIAKALQVVWDGIKGIASGILKVIMFPFTIIKEIGEKFINTITEEWNSQEGSFLKKIIHFANPITWVGIGLKSINRLIESVADAIGAGDLVRSVKNTIIGTIADSIEKIPLIGAGAAAWIRDKYDITEKINKVDEGEKNVIISSSNNQPVSSENNTKLAKNQVDYDIDKQDYSNKKTEKTMKKNSDDFKAVANTIVSNNNVSTSKITNVINGLGQNQSGQPGSGDSETSAILGGRMN